MLIKIFAKYIMRKTLQKRSRRTQRKQTRRNKKGGTKKGIIQTAIVPFGLFALHHISSRNNKKMKKRKTLKKGKGKN